MRQFQRDHLGKSARRLRESTEGKPKTGVPRMPAMSREELMALKGTTELRLVGNNADKRFLATWMDNPDPYLDEIGTLWTYDKIAACLNNSENPFWGSHPAEGEVSLPEDFIQLGTSFLGWPVIGLPASAALENVLIIGETGSGKSSLAEVLAKGLVENESPHNSV